MENKKAFSERYYIVAEERPGYYIEWGWIFYHDPAKFQETETTIEIDCELAREHHKEAPKEMLVEITKEDYELIKKVVESGYDGANILEQVIHYRKHHGTEE